MMEKASGSLLNAIFGSGDANDQIESVTGSTSNGISTGKVAGLFDGPSRLFDSTPHPSNKKHDKKRSKRALAKPNQDHLKEVINEESFESVVRRRRCQASCPLLKLVTARAPLPANATEESDGSNDGDDDYDCEYERALPIDVQFQEVADIVLEHGFCVLENVISKRLLDKVSIAADSIEKKICAALNKKGIGWKAAQGSSNYTGNQMNNFRFVEVASRCRGRMDTRYQTADAPFNDDAIVRNRNLLPTVHRLLGGEQQQPCLVYAGLIFSFPGSDDQPWHQDGMPLFPELMNSRGALQLQIPPYALNIFIPLSGEDASIEAGPTEFIPGSHLLSEEAVMKIADHHQQQQSSFRGTESKKRKSNNSEEQRESTPPLSSSSSSTSTIASPILCAGDALIYDYRVCHRGTANLTHLGSKPEGGAEGQQHVRRVLYLMYARPWFKEHLNFGTEPLFSGVKDY